MELRLVADTNLFFECKTLEQLPWGDLGSDQVAILLTKPVLDEIDKHKRGTGRTRNRALEIFGRVRDMLIANTTEFEILASSPRVILRRVPFVRPDPSLGADLDYTRADDRLVGIVSTMNAEGSSDTTKLFTGDTGAASTAADLGVPYLFIDSSWRRPYAETTEAMRIRELEKDLATYRAQEPRISIGHCLEADPMNVLKVTRRVAAALTASEVEETLLTLRTKHPLMMDFSLPPTSSRIDATGEIVRTVYLPPLDEAVAEYRDVSYPRWIEACRNVLVRLHEGKVEVESPLVVRWPMANVGTRPASQARVEFEAKGLIELHRLQDADEDVKDGSSGTEPPASAPHSRLPSPPRSPPFQTRVTRMPQPSPQAEAWRSHDPSAATIDQTLRQERTADFAFRAADRTSLSSVYKDLAMFDKYTDPGSVFASIPKIARVSADEIRASVMSTDFPSDLSAVLRFQRPEPHYPESFYWDWPLDEPVNKGALTCELWRHRVSEELFRFEARFTKDGAVRGSIECTVHAGNLTEPEKARVIVTRTIEPFSLLKLASEMIAACN